MKGEIHLKFSTVIQMNTNFFGNIQIHLSSYHQNVLNTLKLQKLSKCKCIGNKRTWKLKRAKENDNNKMCRDKAFS